MKQKKLSSFLLAIIMAVSLLPMNSASVFAEETSANEQGVASESAFLTAIKDGCTKIRLLSDIELTEKLDLSDKNIELDLNGHVLEGEIELADTPAEPQSVLTLTDSSPYMAHADSSILSGGFVDGSITLTNNHGSDSILNANGGTVGRLNLYSFVAKVYCTNNKPTAFLDTLFAVSNASVHGGIFYTELTSCVKEPMITFQADNKEYAYEVVASGSTSVAPRAPYKQNAFFNGWYNGNTQYVFGSAVSKDITLTADWTLVQPVSKESDFSEALEKGITYFKLISAVKLTKDLDLSNKNITIDLNGQILYDKQITINTGYGRATLTLIDSNPMAKHEDQSLPVGGIINCELKMSQEKIAGEGDDSWHDCNFYAYGGSVMKRFYANTQAVSVKGNQTSMQTAFYGSVDGYMSLFGGIYYGEITSKPQIKGKVVTFRVDGKDYAREIVADGNPFVLPTQPTKAGANFDGWYNGNQKYEYRSPINEDITLTAKFRVNRFSVVDASTKNGKATATIGVPVRGTYTIVFADYDGKKLNAVDVVTQEIEEADIVTITSENNMTLNKGDKVMLWMGIDFIRPWCDAYVVQ